MIFSAPEGGYGTLTVNESVGAGLETFSSNNGGISFLSLTVDNQPFTLADGSGQATFLNGALASLIYTGQVAGNGGTYQLDLDTAGLFYLYVDTDNLSLLSAGTISAVLDPPSAAPLPPAIVLLEADCLHLVYLQIDESCLGPILPPVIAAAN